MVKLLHSLTVNVECLIKDLTFFVKFGRNSRGYTISSVKSSREFWGWVGSVYFNQLDVLNRDFPCWNIFPFWLLINAVAATRNTSPVGVSFKNIDLLYSKMEQDLLHSLGDSSMLCSSFTLSLALSHWARWVWSSVDGALLWNVADWQIPQQP